MTTWLEDWTICYHLLVFWDFCLILDNFIHRDSRSKDGYLFDLRVETVWGVPWGDGLTSAILQSIKDFAEATPPVQPRRRDLLIWVDLEKGRKVEMYYQSFQAPYRQKHQEFVKIIFSLKGVWGCLGYAPGVWDIKKSCFFAHITQAGWLQANTVGQAGQRAKDFSFSFWPRFEPHTYVFVPAPV